MIWDPPFVPSLRGILEFLVMKHDNVMKYIDTCMIPVYDVHSFLSQLSV